MMNRKLFIFDAPTNLGLMPPAKGQQPGTRFAPETYRKLGLHEILHPHETAVVAAPPYEEDEDREVNVRNISQIANYAGNLADAISGCFSEDNFVLVLGGDCSLLLGTMLANARRGSAALLFIDGHSDFYLPEQSSTGGAAGMDLAMVMGWGPSQLTNIEGKGPYVLPERVAALGNRSPLSVGTPDIPSLDTSGALYISLSSMRDIGVKQATNDAIARISPTGEPYWIHLDVDVIDSSLMPAVDSPQPGGLQWDELEMLLAVALAGNVRGLQVTIYDPLLDPEYRCGKVFVDILARVL